MPGSNFLLFYLMATNLSTEETGKQGEGVGGKFHVDFGGGRNCLSCLFIYSPPILLRKHCSPGENWVSGGRRCDLGLVASALASPRRGQPLLTLGVLETAGFAVQEPNI